MSVYGSYLTETAKEFVGSTNVNINGKKYEVIISSDFEWSKEDLNERMDEIKKRCEYLVKNEKKIIDQVYEIYKKSYKDKMNKFESDKKKDKIDNFEIIDHIGSDKEFTVGIFLSNLNQFYTVFQNGKVLKNETYVY